MKEGEGRKNKKAARTQRLFILHPSSLPLHGAFLRRINLCLFVDGKRFVEEEPLDVIEQEILRVRTGEIQTVVIDYLCLLLQPRCPAGLTYLGSDSLPEFVGKRRETDRRSFLTTMFAFDIVSHVSSVNNSSHPHITEITPIQGTTHNARAYSLIV